MRRLNLLYLYAPGGSIWDDNEIRYSIRSMADTNDVASVSIVAPEIPSFLTDVLHIACNIRPGQKFHNLISQLFTAMNNPLLEEDLILMNDDFFMRKTPVWDWTPTWMTELDLSKTKGNAWHKSILHTGRKLQEHGVKGPIYSYEGHTPMPIRKSLALKTLCAIIPWAAEYPIQFRTAYGNINRIGGKQHTNAKHKALDLWPEDSPFLSTKKTISPEIKDYIQKAWPTPSRWEAK